MENIRTRLEDMLLILAIVPTAMLTVVVVRNYMAPTNWWGVAILIEIPSLLLLLVMRLLIANSKSRLFLVGIIPAAVILMLVHMANSVTSVKDAGIYAFTCALIGVLLGMAASFMHKENQ